jgi:hypothetical protein
VDELAGMEGPAAKDSDVVTKYPQVDKRDDLDKSDSDSTGVLSEVAGADPESMQRTTKPRRAATSDLRPSRLGIFARASSLSPNTVMSASLAKLLRFASYQESPPATWRSLEIF